MRPDLHPMVRVTVCRCGMEREFFLKNRDRLTRALELDPRLQRSARISVPQPDHPVRQVDRRIELPDDAGRPEPVRADLEDPLTVHGRTRVPRHRRMTEMVERVSAIDRQNIYIRRHRNHRPRRGRTGPVRQSPSMTPYIHTQPDQARARRQRRRHSELPSGHQRSVELVASAFRHTGGRRSVRRPVQPHELPRRPGDPMDRVPKIPRIAGQ